MEKSKLMIEYESRTGLKSVRIVGDHWCSDEAHTEAYVDDLEERLTETQAKAAAYDELKCTPNLPDEYNVFLVYLVRNGGDFHKTIRVLTDEGRCSLECMAWFAMMLGISWEPDWR